MDISFQKLTEENIAALGYPKPDYPDPAAAGMRNSVGCFSY